MTELMQFLGEVVLSFAFVFALSCAAVWALIFLGAL